MTVSWIKILWKKNLRSRPRYHTQALTQHKRSQKPGPLFHLVINRRRVHGVNVGLADEAVGELWWRPSTVSYNAVSCPGIRTKTTSTVKVEKISDTTDPSEVAALPFSFCVRANRQMQIKSRSEGNHLRESHWQKTSKSEDFDLTLHTHTTFLYNCSSY